MSFYDPTENLALCSGNCQASRYPPSSCRCPCQGRNHGVLRHRQPFVDVTAYRTEESYPSERVIPLLPVERLQLTARDLAHDLDLPKVPEVQNRVSDNLPRFGAEIRRTSRGRAIGRRVARSLKHSLAGYSESELNERILKGLRSQFSQDNTDIAVDQAFSVYQSHNPDLPRPELYELYETGLIDKALELMGKRWVIGRPKK